VVKVDGSVYDNLPVQIAKDFGNPLAVLVDSITGKLVPKNGRNSVGSFTADYLLKDLIPDQPINISLNSTEAPYLQVIDVADDQTVINFTNKVSYLSNFNARLLFNPVASIGSLLRSSFTPSGSINSFDIQFDYRFDTNGFFNHPNRRAVLEAAASAWENIIKDEFTDIPTGSGLFIENPQTGAEERFITNNDIDDLVVFVGAQELGTGVLGEGGPSGLLTNSSLVDRYNGSNFEPWTGSITFSETSDWFFDPTPNTSDDIPSGSYDFFSSALHELGHVLGIGTSSAFRALTIENSFTGSRSTAANGGPVPLSSDLSHLMVNGQNTLMDPSSPPGLRSFIAPLDTAVLADLGYLV